MHIFFVPLYDFFRRNRLMFWLVFAGTFLAWVLLAVNIRLKEDISSMLPESRSLKTMNEVVSRTQAGEQVIFLLSSPSAQADNDSLVAAASAFREDIQNKFGEYIDTILLQPATGIEESMISVVQEYLPLFLDESDYRKIDSLVVPQQVEQTLASNKKILLSPASTYYKQLVAADPVGMNNIAWNKLRSLQLDDDYEVYDGYLLYKPGGQLTFFLKTRYPASETGKNSKFFSGADEFIDNWEKDHPGIHITYFGGPAVAAGNAAQMRTDTILTLSVTVVLLLALTFYFFRRKRTPFLLLVPVLYGGIMGMGIVALVQPGISVIALGAGAIIMGIAIDFSIHFLSHVRFNNDIRATVKELSQPLTLGSFTTIAAFLSLRLVSTPILQDLGLFAAASLFGAALCTLIFLPHLPMGTTNKNPKPTIFDRIALWKPENNKWLLTSIVLITPVMLYFSTGVEFDSNLMNLNYMSPRLEKAQEEVSRINAAALSSVFVVAEGTDESHAVRNLETVTPVLKQMQQKGWVMNLSNPTLLLPSEQEQQKRLARWNDYWNKERKEELMKTVSRAATAAGFSAAAFAQFDDRLNRIYQPFNTEAKAILKGLFPGGYATGDGKQYTIAVLKVPAEHRSKVFDALENKKEVIITDRQQGASQLVSILTTDFTDIALYSSFIVFIALLIGYGRIELAVFAFLPMVVSWVWILGIMSLLGLKFNVVNIIISSLIFGLGDDYTIFTMDGLTERYRKGKEKLTSVRAAVYLSVLTVIIGLGVLLLAKHPALRSIAFISVTGLLCVLFISQTLQPFLFNWFIQRRADKGLHPFTLRSFIISVFAFAYFFTGSMILTVLGVIFTKLWPFNKEKGKYIFHVCISRFTWSMMYIMVNLGKRVYNPAGEDFNKPAVYIANHSSFLDILLTTMLHPRLVLLTNRWVWRSPVFGAVVRMGEYYPVADGAEDSIEPLKDLTGRGYSVMVFPEGTRSYDDSIKRFHKGAFYIAEKLQLDIVPVVLHGVHYSMQKGDWLLKDGTCSIYIHERIHPADERFGQGYSSRAKYIGRWMREQLAEVKIKNETPSYFREQLIRSYTYKGPVLEWYCRIKTKLEGNYEQFHELLPRAGKFYDLGCGYGFMAYMLHWAAPARHFIGIDYDEDKIETAKNNFLHDEGIDFVQGDLSETGLLPCDGIILADVLHYLLPEQQEALLEKCYKALNEYGVLIVRDGISELTERIKGTKLTEVFSTKLLGFNKTQNQLHFISRKLLDDFAAKHNLQVDVLDNAKMTANLTFVLRK